MAACASHDADTPVTPVNPPVPPTTPVERPIAFMPTDQPTSRAIAMENLYTVFKVWSYKHTPSTTENVMPGYSVRYIDDTDRWQYDGTKYTTYTELTDQFLKFWDASADYYDFFAIPERKRDGAGDTPVTLPEGVTITSDASGITITGLTGHSSEVRDMLMAHQRRDIYTDQSPRDRDMLVGTDDGTPDVYYESVPLVFHRMFAEVNYYIYNTGTETAKVTCVDINYDKGETMITGGVMQNGVWTDPTTTGNLLYKNYEGDPVELEHIEKANYQTESYTVATYYEIPQRLKPYLNVSVDIDGRIASRRIEMPDEAWLPDHTYKYYIRIEAGESQGDPIYIDLISIDDFTPGTDIDDTETNW